MRAIIAFAVLCAFAATAATAAPKPQDLIEACREASASDADRIACLEAALFSLGGKKSPKKQQEAKSAAREVQPAAEASPSIADDAAPTGLGAEQVKARLRSKGEAPKEDKPPKEKVIVEISEIVYPRSGRTLFFTEDGQIWRETDSYSQGRRLSTNKKYTAEITQSMFGGYRMNIDGVRRIIKVERLQ